jgi:hypothetical protein
MAPETPAPTPPLTKPAPPVAEQPAPAEPVRPAQPPDREPASEPPTPPPYLHVLETARRDRRATVDARVEPPATLRVATQNVRRLRIDRDRLPLPTTGSVELRIDGQGFEWTSRYDIIDLELSPSGTWKVVERRP